MNCSRGPFEYTIDAVGQVDNFGFVSPFSARPSANSQYGRLTAGMLTESFPPVPEFNKSVSGTVTCKDRMTCSYTDDFDSQYVDQLDDMEAGDKSAITGQAQENDDGTVSVETAANPAETIKEQESFMHGGRLRHFQGGKFKVNNGGIVHVAKSKRVNPHTEHFGTTELNGFKDSQYMHEAFLDTKEEQEQSNATSLVILTVCFFFITLAVIWTTFGCQGGCDKAPAQSLGGGHKPTFNQPKASLTGGGNKSSSGKLSGSIF